MKIFQEIIKYCQIIGYFNMKLPDSFRKFRIHWLHKFFIFLPLFIGLVTVLMFVLIEATGMQDLAEAFPMVISHILYTILYCVLMWDKVNILKLIADLEAILTTRKKSQSCILCPNLTFENSQDAKPRRFNRFI